MKILHILYTSLPNISGSSIRSRDIIKSQSDLGISQIVITSPFQEPLTKGKKIEIINNIKYYRTYAGYRDEHVTDKMSKVSLQLRKGIRLFKFIYFVYKIAKKEKVDILHAHSMFFCAIPAYFSSILLKKSFIYEVRSLWEERYKTINFISKIRFSIFTMIETFCMFLSKDLIVICKGLRERLLTKFILSRKKIHVIPNAINISNIASSSSISNKLYNEINFGYIGSLSSIEGLDLLINTFIKLEKNGFNNKLIIVGDGSEKDNLVKLSGISKIIEFKNPVQANNVKSMYDLIDIIILPRRNSLLANIVTPLKPLEAIMYKKVVMASNIGGITELLEHNKTAILFEPDSEDAIYNSIIKVLKNNNFDLLIENGLRHVSENFSWSINASIYKSVYKNLLNK